MKRVIKFRAFNPTDNIMYYQSDGLRLKLNHDGGVSVMLLRQDAFKCELMQFTGLKDKNEKDIYESDIIKWSFVNTGESDDDNKFYIEIVEWSECGFFLDGGAPLTVAMDDCEVIGNIYENPDLL